ncbi:MAG TPA: hypothetical protein PLO70_11480 [Chitinophagaceae bacterium]|nr:hypothetical protein [Chitinophagaceae bacterium]HQZ75132.1 hypothetical protein [Chitinophagaceae bacterium]
MTINTRSMRSSSNALFAIVLISTAMLGCSKKDTPIPDPCLGVSYDVQYFKTEAIGSSNNGTIAITFPIGDTISYQLNSGAYQASPGFTNLAPGNYVITVKNQNGCTDTAQITILNYGPKYALVKQIINGYCGPCHLNGAVNGSKNFDTDASIVSSWDRIKARAVDGNPSFMPAAPNSPLTNVDKQKITDWVNAGHRQSD